MSKRIAVTIVLVLTAAGVAAVIGVARATGDGKPNPPHSTFSVAQARAMRDFPVYSAGDSVDGYPLVAVLRNVGGVSNYVSFIYGDCVASGERGCAPPAEVQVWPACVRNVSLYDGPMSPPFERTEVRGAPAFVFEEGHRIEIQTGESTVVVFGQSPELVDHVSSRLRGVNLPVQAAERLPAPALGALEGKLACG
jgi:hypothetical protein